MKKAGKILSAFLAVMMSTSAVSAFSITADAATAGGTVTVTSNVCDTVKCAYTKDSEKLTVSFDLDADLWLLNEQSVLTYDANVLKVSKTNSVKTMLPEMYSTAVANTTSTPGAIYFNSTDPGLYDFKTSKTFFTVEFDIIGGGNTTVDLDVEIMTAVDVENPTDLQPGKPVNMVKYVTDSQVVNNGFTMKASAKATGSSFTSDSIYFACPVFSAGSEWDEIYLAYSSSSTLSNATKLPLEKTDLVYTMSDEVTGVLATNANWAIYKLTPTAAEAKAIDAASYTGFVNKTGTIRTNFIWANAVTRANIGKTGYGNAKHTVEELKGKTFVINNSVDGNNRTSYLGYWTSKAPEEVVATIYSASPIVDSSTTMGNMYFRYGTDSTITNAGRIRMAETDYLYTAENLSSTKLQAGEWVVYELGLTQAQVDAINACNYTAFSSPYGATIRTNYTYGNSVTRANIGKAGYSSAKHTIAQLNGKMFFITGSAAANTVSYTGNWDNYNANIKTVTLKVAVPTVVGTRSVNSMNMLYSVDSDIETASVIKMTKTSESFKPASVNTKLIASNAKWVVYEATIGADKYNAMAKAKRVAFATDDKKVRTCFNYTNNVLRGGVGTYVNPFDAAAFTHPEELDGRTFVMCGAVTEKNTISLNGYWK